ncbi:formylglycine-generating enzyme family protein [Pseudomonas sp. NBRC 111119]|uniref:formylglycine-generating enzyme family protein n=1 Tax=Pseudomonas sp. NBRC 111119 TaxID=1661034 RepID=UPI0007613BA2|nr:formylglycine-generating enzyme family protein [Pseudomonas sp. NBRC 111119]
MRPSPPAVRPLVLATLALLTLVGAPPTTLAATVKPGTVFKDCEQGCPEMVVLPTGSFMMGTPDDEMGRQDDEGPIHKVTIARPLAISRFQITFDEWDAFIAATGYRMPSGDDRPGRLCRAGTATRGGRPTYGGNYQVTGRHPAVCMNLEEVEDYVAWLSRKTGKNYRLTSESVREYAARAGSSGAFPFPFDEGKDYSIAKHANTYGPVDGFSYTSPVGSYPANAFGVYDMHGNVYEWLADCEHENYVGAPTDGSAWIEPNCTSYQIRGNDYGEAPIFSRSGNRNNILPSTRGDWVGFRVVRDL